MRFSLPAAIAASGGAYRGYVEQDLDLVADHDIARAQRGVSEKVEARNDLIADATMSDDCTRKYLPGERLPSSRQKAARICPQSMPRGPSAEPLRNWRTNWFSEENIFCASPDSTMRPFHRSAMYSPMRRAEAMSWVTTM